jgi:prepilin-type N-terminal cleavage/methylation domain-containing protein
VQRALGQVGFTLVEVLVATAVGLIAMAGFASFNISQMYAMRNQANQIDLQSSARSIADMFAREVRRAGSGTNVGCVSTVSTGVLVAQTSQVRIRADLDGNGVLTGSNEDITYTVDSINNQITRTDNGSARTDTLWSGTSISGSQLRYYDAAGGELAPPTTGLTPAQLLQVRRIRLQLALTGKVGQPRNSLLQTASESANVQLRNRYFVMAPTCAYN